MKRCDILNEFDANNTKTKHIDAWLSLVERCVRDAEVAGSNPVASTLGRGAGAFEEIQMFRFFIVF